jgi:GntR family transcriptional regulator
VGIVDSFIPVYYRMEKFLRDQIRSGALKPGAAVPPESQLARQFSVSRMTVRQALSRLVFEGLVVRHRGRGSFVAEPRLEHTKMFWSFEEEMQARGAKTAHKLLDLRVIRAEGKVAENLGLRTGTLITRLERQRFVDGQLIGYEVRYLPRRIGEALTQDEIHNQPLVPAVKRILGRSPTRISLRLTCSVVRRQEARILEAKVGAPLLIREHVWHLDPDGPVQYGKSIFRGDRYQMFVEFTSVRPAPSPGT